jgi:hypothetical protein
MNRNLSIHVLARTSLVLRRQKMSNVSMNKKYLNLNEIRISYKVKDDSIHITSDDEDLTGSGFHLTLGKNSESEQILRKLLIEKGLIRPAKPDTLPFFCSFGDGCTISI